MISRRKSRMEHSHLRNKIITLHNSVARQHSLFLNLLDTNMQNYIADTYLLFRMLDTIEDSDIDDNIREKLFESADENFIQFLNQAEKTIKNNIEIEPNYRNLFENLNTILEFHFSLPQTIQPLIEKTGRFMAKGMLKYAVRFRKAKEENKREFISTIEELEEYCHIAAGCVGELNVKLFAEENKLTGNISALLSGGKALGIYLQLVNVLRDFSEDSAKRKKSYLPLELNGHSDKYKIHTIINTALLHKKAIEEFIDLIPKSCFKDYCRTIFNVASKHYDFYERHPEYILKGKRVPANHILFSLPLKLQTKFILFNFKKKLIGN